MSSPRPVSVVAAFAFAFAAATSACTPKPGRSCRSEAKEVCVDGKGALVCHDGVWRTMACLGPGGCRDGACDQTLAVSKDACNRPDERACATDARALLTCSDGAWVVAARCLGDRGCSETNGELACDSSVAEAGDACREEGARACAAAGGAALACRGGVFAVERPCRGPDGCRVLPAERSDDETRELACDDSIASPGDACALDGRHACSVDGRAVLKCGSGAFALAERCHPNEVCETRGGLVGCY